MSAEPSALRILEQETIHLVITDIRMPQHSGVDLLRLIKDSRPEIQVIILTGYAHLDTAMKAVEYGAFVYLEKPFDNEMMLKYVRAGVEKNRVERERRILEHLAIEANRFETLGRMVTGMMHDMGTPLTVIGSQIEIIMANPEREDIVERLHTMYAQVRHCSDMVRAAMNFLRHDAKGATPFCLNNVIDTCLEVARPSMRGTNAVVTKDFADELPSCMGDLVLVRQAVLNVIMNACHAMSKQTEPRELILKTWSEEGYVCLTVEDTGPGVPPEHRDKIFETFFTTKTDSGTGLGLSVVKNVMRRHKGSVTLLDKPGRGAKFLLKFPVATTEDVLHLFRQTQEDQTGSA
jgi:signal transduction histidine kinase